MGKIKVIGKPHEIEVSNKDIKKFREDKNSGLIEAGDEVTLGPWSGKVSDVRSTTYDQESRANEEQTEKQLQLMREFHEKRREFHALPVKEKAKRATENQFGLYWQCLREDTKKKEIPREIKVKAFLIAKKFYEDNPGRMIVDVSEWEKVKRMRQGKINSLGYAGIKILIGADRKDYQHEIEDRQFEESRYGKTPQKVI